MTLSTDKTAALRQAAREAEVGGDYARAEQALRAALAADPGNGSSVLLLADFLSRRGRFSEAESLYTQLLAAFPDAPAPLNGFAVLLNKTGRPSEAIAIWNRLHQNDPKLTAPLINIGLALRSMGDAEEAVAYFERALAVDPRQFDAHLNLGATYLHSKRYEQALANLEAARRLRPDHVRARVLLAQTAQAVCDWDRFDEAMPVLQGEADKAAAGRACAVTPWFSLRLPLTLRQRRMIAAAASRDYEAVAAPIARQLRFSFAPRAKDRLSVGYISSDFRDHPLMQLTAGMYRRHDRARFRVIAYPVKRPNAAADAILREGCDEVADVSGLSDADAARRIHADGIDILVDLSGFNQFMRPTILACRPAPVQVLYLSFAGTLGGRLYDYLIGDPIVTPPEHAGDYAEAIARLPHCYQINDRDQKIAPPPPRAAEGLPDNAFVFACFCVGEKIERNVFAVWMSLLAETPHAVLWLLGESPLLQANLRRAAAAAGIDPARLIFARRQPKTQHLGRLALADLHFDTGTYGAHTTGSDALWAGVPLVSVLGDTFPARVGASLLQAVGLPELIARDWDAYRSICLDLARNPERLLALRMRLTENRLSVPLFDTDCSVRDLEALYEKMWALRVAGEPAMPIQA